MYIVSLLQWVVSEFNIFNDSIGPVGEWDIVIELWTPYLYWPPFHNYSFSTIASTSFIASANALDHCVTG